MTRIREQIRLALPSKGRLAEQSFEFLERCGLRVFRPNSRQYIATIPTQPNVQVILQRPGDIVIGVRQGSLDFGITGLDMVREKNHADKTLILHEALGFGHCSLNLAVPDALADVVGTEDLAHYAKGLIEENRPMRVATKFPNLTAAFLDQHNIAPYKLINAEGTLEIAPMIGYADIIVDLVSSGMTLRDNHLHPLVDGEILRSQACLIANRNALKTRQDVLAFAKTLLEYIEAHQRANESYMVIANVRGDSATSSRSGQAETIAQKLFNQPDLHGLRGPTISPVFTRDNESWFSISIAIKKRELNATIAALRQAGGSGVIVTPAIYIFEEEPERYRAMLAEIGDF